MDAHRVDLDSIVFQAPYHYQRRKQTSADVRSNPRSSPLTEKYKALLKITLLHVTEIIKEMVRTPE
jgi:hypothetical protein